MTMWPYPTATDGNFITFLQSFNNILGGKWAVMIVFVIFIVSFLSLGRFFKEEALTASAFITFITTIVFRTLGLIGDYWVFLWLLILAVSIVLIHKND